MSNDKYENRNEENADEGAYGCLIFVMLIVLVLAQLLSVLNY